LGARSPVGHAAARGSGHEAYHDAAEAGCFQLFARNVQQAVDFTLIARRVAELGLTTGIVAVDSEQTALSVQDVHLPSPDLVRDFIGSAEDGIPSPTEAQKLLFGPTRRRVPRFHDLDRPLLTGGFQGPETWALGRTGQGLYFTGHVPDLLERTLSDLEKRTGRAQSLVSSYKTDDANVIWVAQGSVIETAEAMVDWLRKERKQKIGVLGVHCLRPFPAAKILEIIGGKQKVAVLERLDAPFGSEAPLIREIRSAAGRALENGRLGSSSHPGFPSWSGNLCPSFHSVLYGLGGQPARAADLALLASDLESKGRSLVYLGVEIAPESSPYPKREVLLDQLRREYPGAADLALRSKETSPDIRPEESLTIAVHRVSGSAESLAAEAAALVHHLAGGRIRSRPSTSWGRHGAHEVDRFTHSVNPLRDPGDDVRDDIAVVANGRCIDNLREGGIAVAISEESDNLHVKNAEIMGVPTAEDEAARNEHLLGGLAGVLATRFGLKSSKCSSARADMLGHIPEDERRALLSAFDAGLTGLHAIETATEPPTRPPHDEHEIPMAVRVLETTDSTLDSLPRFWDQVGVLYKNGEAHELSADPYLATGAVPPLTSTFRDFSETRDTLPVFDPSVCTGCGACWTWCPDGALAPLVAGPAALLEAGMKMAKADALRPVVSQLANRVTTEIKKADPAPRRLGESLDTAFTWLKEKMPMAEDRQQAVQEAFDAATAPIGALPIAKTAPFFDEAETRAKGSGELLSIAVNPDACKGCGLCIRVCEPEALVDKPQDGTLLKETRRGWRLWEQLPDTTGETIDRAREHADVGPTAAMLLSRSCLFALAGGDGAEAGSGEKIALRLTLGAAEYHQQPRTGRMVADLDEARERLAAQIRETLADALPSSDFESLSEGLSSLGGTSSNLPALIEKVHGTIEQSRVDTKRLRRQVKTAQQLADAHHRMTQAAGGMGRARIGLAVAADSSTSWTSTFPDNPFSAPVFVDMSGDTSELAAGLVEGQLAAAMEVLVTLRRAKLELENPDDAERESAALGELTWHDLTTEERQSCPPLVLMGSADALTRNGLAPILELLGSDMPVKVLSFSDLTLSGDGKPRDPGFDLAFTSMGLRKPFVAQTSISEPLHFYESARAAFSQPGPALLHVHTPSPGRHGFDRSKAIEQAKLAVTSRTFPLIQFDPAGEGVFGLHINLEGNPEPQRVLVSDGNETPLTPAQWAITEKRFAGDIRPMADSAPSPTPLMDFMELPENQRDGKTPFITVEDERWAISEKLAARCEERIGVWRTLQEWAGLVTPFTERVREEADKAVAESHQAELQSLRNEYETKIKDLGAAKETEIAQKIKDQLLTLTGYKK
jgi:pyruvate-ferredoxin/flavodoxin oxidoreductase